LAEFFGLSPHTIDDWIAETAETAGDRAEQCCGVRRPTFTTEDRRYGFPWLPPNRRPEFRQPEFPGAQKRAAPTAPTRPEEFRPRLADRLRKLRKLPKPYGLAGNDTEAVPLL
jgi:hypothetical protein